MNSAAEAKYIPWSSVEREHLIRSSTGKWLTAKNFDACPVIIKKRRHVSTSSSP